MLRARLWVCVLLLAAVRPAAAEDEPTPPGWRFEIQPYAWLPFQVTGDVTAADRTIPVDATIGDLFDTLQLAGQLRFEAWWRRFGFVVDSTYLQAGEDGVLAEIPFELTNRLFYTDILANYRIGTWPLTGSADLPSVGLEVNAGGRVTWLGTDLDVGGADLGGDEWLGKAVIGARVPVRLSPRWAVGVRGEFRFPHPSGYLLGGGMYNVSRFAIYLGYRVEWINVVGDMADLDATAHGLYLGLGIRFGDFQTGWRTAGRPAPEPPAASAPPSAAPGPQ